MRKFTLFLAFIFIGMQLLQAQNREITGAVTSSDDGQPIPGVQVLVKGTTTGTVTDLDGKYSIDAPASATTLIFRFVGMATKEVEIGTQSVIDVVMEPDILNLEGVVVTALGISREKKSLGYATQELTGDEINQVKTDNFINTLSGKAAGVQVKNSGNLGGSSNILIRGSSSITGNNQALIVVDGVPINNDIVNSRDQVRGRAGYDFGNAGADVNPADIESMNILKGAAATALYGSRAANGVIIITTKKGEKTMAKKRVYGVSISSNVTTGFIDKTTFPKYQQNYGAGYGPYYGDVPYAGFEYFADVNGDGETDYTVPTYEDASFGQKFDPNLMVYQYDAMYPESPNYRKATPWVAPGDNGPISFFETPWSFTNSVDVTSGTDVSSFRLSFTNQDQTGIMPNSRFQKNSVLFNGSYDITKDVTVSASVNYINNKGKGRNPTGYSDNIMSSFRQWSQMNVDYQQQKELYDATGRNITWNPVGAYIDENGDTQFDVAPAYWDNPYFQRFESYETDDRDRLIGYIQADWQINDFLSVMGRYSTDTYSYIQEERKAVGSAAGEFGVGTTAGRSDVTSGYSKLSRNFRENNMDVMLKFNKNLTEDWNLNALIGTNIRRSTLDQVFASTDGGLIVPGLYSLGNSVNPMLAPEETYNKIGVNGIYASASIGYKNLVYIDGTIRRDQSSTLPEDNNDYYYPSISGSFLFSNLVETNWLSFGKARVNYAQVGNDAPWGSILDTYDGNPVFGGTPLYSVPNTKNNPDLKPENTTSIEAGLEMYFLNKRLGFDFAWYKINTVDQIIPVAVSYATGYSTKYVNAGEMQNTGVELTLFGSPVATNDFKWDITLNWAKNTNEVVSLAEGVENLQLASLQSGLTINARVGEPYGTIQGTDYIYDDAGNKVVAENGYYLRTTTSDVILGNINPDWTGGIKNSFSYKNWALSFLIDWQQGGSVFSLDMYYGLGTGLYEETDYINDLGNPVRNSLDDGGGLILDGVTGDVTYNPDGSYTVTNTAPNTTRVAGDDYRVFGWSRNPNSRFVYDATYIKLREVVITYKLPEKVIENSFLNGVSFSLVGSNLWIISKDLPHADPEASQGAGNVQGWQSGVMPTTRNVGFTVNLNF
ncbi:MAG: SusC/RagA family TonB-linked outer membrane protein [Bacteroidales bacterium]|nr:SusC/RagA family TonB-linked outer membrane protein [Bacteroidales bacterium]